MTNTSLDNISFVYSEYIEYVITNYTVNLVRLFLMAVIFSGLSNCEQRKSGTSVHEIDSSYKPFFFHMVT